MQKRKRQLKTRSYGANKITSGGTHNSFNYLTSNGVVDNIVAKKQTQVLDLFINPEEQGIIEQADIILQNNNGKGVYLTPSQTKLVFAIAQIVDTQFNYNQELEDYIKYLPTKYDKLRDIMEGNSRVNVSSIVERSVSVVVDIMELTKVVYGSKGGKQLALMRDELTALASTCHLMKIGKTTFVQPFIIIKGGAITGDTRKLKIEIGDIFLYDIKKKGGYCLAPLTLLPLWNEYGDNSELTTLLVTLLMKVRGNYVAKAGAIVAATEAELKKKKAAPEMISKELEKIGREALTYRESLKSLLDRLPNIDAYYREKNGKRYFRKETADRNIKKTGQSLINMGIITEWYIKEGTYGDMVLNFVLNPNWLKEEKEYMQSLPNSAEIVDAEVIEE